jgi:Tfp pilus assembly protein PilF
LASDILEKTGQYLQQKGLVPLADCFAKDDAIETSVVPLIFQHNLNRAAQYIVQARQLSESGKWTEAIDLVNHAVSIVPSYSPAYLLMAEYLLKEKNQPELALAAVQKALRDGCCFIPAMKLNMLCLNRLKSDEEQIYAYLVKKSEEKGISTYPVQLPDFIKIQTDTTIPDLIINSAGCAVEGKDQPPDERFTQAMIKFQNAKSDEDVRGVLILLLKAISCQPFSAKTHNLIGACLRHLNQPMLALPFLWQAVRLKPDYDLSLTNLGICCDQLGQRKSAAYYFNHPAVTQSTNNWVKKQKNGFKTIQ